MNCPPTAFGLLSLVLVAPAEAVSFVDDFELGPFSFTSSAYAEQTVPLPEYPGHAIHSARKIVLDPTGGTNALVRIRPGHFDGDDVLQVTFSGQGGGAAHVRWEWNTPRDLTVGGTVDYVVVVIEDAPSGGRIAAILTDPFSGESVEKFTDGGAQALTFYFSEWTVANPRQATQLAFRFDDLDMDESYLIRDIRFHRHGGFDVDFVGNFVATQIPPNPSPPLRFTMFDATLQPYYEASMSLKHQGSDPPALAAQWFRQSGPAGDRGLTEVRWNAGGFFPFELTLSVDFLPAGGPVPEVFPPDPIYPPDPIDEARTIALQFPVRMVTDDMGTSSATSNNTLLLDVDPRQGAHFESVVVTPHGVARSASSWTTGFDITFYYNYDAGVDEIWPLFHASWVADINPWMATGAPETAPARAPGALQVRPSVMGESTEIVAGRPFRADDALTIHDVTGRLVQSLRAPEGGRSVRWTGTSATGRIVPAGVYFIRLQDAAGTAVARVTRVR